MYGTILTVAGSALAFGNEDKFGDTMWRSLDAMVISSLGAQAMKYAFQRERPSQTSNPNEFFKGTPRRAYSMARSRRLPPP